MSKSSTAAERPLPSQIQPKYASASHTEMGVSALVLQRVSPMPQSETNNIGEVLSVVDAPTLLIAVLAQIGSCQL